MVKDLARSHRQSKLLKLYRGQYITKFQVIKTKKELVKNIKLKHMKLSESDIAMLSIEIACLKLLSNINKIQKTC